MLAKLWTSVVRWFAVQAPNFLTWEDHSEWEDQGKVDGVVESGRIWRVWHNATYWFARSHKRIDLHPGDWIKVVERRGTILFIEPLEPGDR